MTFGSWKVSHIASIGFMAAILLFLVFGAGAGESSQLLSSASPHVVSAEQASRDVAAADRDS